MQIGDQTPYTPVRSHATSLAVGRIERIDGDLVTGWAAAVTQEIRPVLKANGRVAELLEWPIERQDLPLGPGFPGAVGFRFRVEGVCTGDTLELFALTGAEFQWLHATQATHPTFEGSFIRQLQKAKLVAQAPEAVAITCWESSHNPIGRAKVLYDIVTTQRPAVLFAYSFHEFGASVWAPLVDSDIELVTIPWNRRKPYHDLLAAERLDFSTVWLCKPRYPTFELAAHVAHPEAKLILDLDDNEEHFAMSAASRRKPYGLPGIGLSRALTANVDARTVASRSLQTKYGGHLVRHARVAHREREDGARKTAPSGRAYRVGFIGTVRPHKNLLAAAQAVAMARWLHRMRIELHILGDVSPPEHRAELQAHGAVVGGVVSSGDLAAKVEQLDCVLTGFPNNTPDFAEITRFQISSKIGDALAAGVPALVPESESVEDLASTPGVYLFQEATFPDALLAALRHTAEIQLPAEFTLESAYASFADAEAVAESSHRAADALRLIESSPRTPERTVASVDRRRNLLLIWKQQDAGLYGRRIDQIARAYKVLNPLCRVVVLELMDAPRWASLREAQQQPDHLSDSRHILPLLLDKQSGGAVDSSGVEYRVFTLDKGEQARRQFETWLAEEQLVPSTTTLVQFPILPWYERLHSVLSAYDNIVDVVDNQFAWTRNVAAFTNHAWQYHVMLGAANAVCFNSEFNMDHFTGLGMLSGKKEVSMIENWYAPPTGYAPPTSGPPDSGLHVLYSGNMNDRVDWNLLLKVADLGMKPWVHLVGTAARTPDKQLRRVLMHERVVYHGPRSELGTLDLLSQAHVAIMPHTADEYSTFMNPLKLSMYEAMGLPVVTTDVPGVSPIEGMVHVAKDRRDFMRTLISLLGSAKAREQRQKVPGFRTRPVPKQATAYVDLIDSVGSMSRGIA